MSNIIKIKRGSGVPGSGVLAGNELGWDVVNKSLYIGVEGLDAIKISDAFAQYLTINNNTGALTTTSSLTVGGITTLNSTLNVTDLSSLDGGIDVNSAFIVTQTGDISTTGTLEIDGDVTLGSADTNTIDLRGTVNISDIAKVTTIKGNLEVDGTTGLDGNLRIGNQGSTLVSIDSTTGNVEIDGTIGVDGVANLRNNVNITGDTLATGNIRTQSNLVVDGNTTLGDTSEDVVTINGVTTINNTLTTTGLSSLNGGIDVNGLVTISSSTGDIVSSGDLTVDNAVVNGNLTVHGTTTTVNSTTVEISDPIFTLGETLATSDAKDRGIELLYGDTTTPLTGFFGLDQGTGRFTFLPNATNTNEVFTDASGVNLGYGSFNIGEIYQPQTNGVYAVDGTAINASQRWNAAATAMGIGSNGTGGITNGTQYDLLQADANGVFQPTKTISASSSITIDCGDY